jgi:hypothetical protein
MKNTQNNEVITCDLHFTLKPLSPGVTDQSL